MMGLTEINLAYYQDLMSGARLAISEGRLDAYIAETQRNWAEGEAEGTLRPAVTLEFSSHHRQGSARAVEPSRALCRARSRHDRCSRRASRNVTAKD